MRNPFALTRSSVFQVYQLYSWTTGVLWSKLTGALDMAPIDETESQPCEDAQLDIDLPRSKNLSPKEVIEKLKVETPISDFERFYQWSSILHPELLENPS
jgi:hypothetical protein